MCAGDGVVAVDLTISCCCCCCCWFTIGFITADGLFVVPIVELFCWNAPELDVELVEGGVGTFGAVGSELDVDDMKLLLVSLVL